MPNMTKYIYIHGIYIHDTPKNVKWTISPNLTQVIEIYRCYLQREILSTCRVSHPKSSSILKSSNPQIHQIHEILKSINLKSTKPQIHPILKSIKRCRMQRVNHVGTELVT